MRWAQIHTHLEYLAPPVDRGLDVRKKMVPIQLKMPTDLDLLIVQIVKPDFSVYRNTWFHLGDFNDSAITYFQFRLSRIRMGEQQRNVINSTCY